MELVLPSRRVPVAYDADVLVVGGGSAGIAAAVAASRAGARVAIVERYGFFGGTLTGVTLGSLVGYYTLDADGGLLMLVGGIGEEVVERLRRVGGATEPRRWLKTASVPYDIFSLKVLFDRMIEEARVKPFLHSFVTDVVMEGRCVRGVVVATKAGPRGVRARVTIDCSGDGDVAALAGAPFEVPAEVQLPSAMFSMGGIDPERIDAMDRQQLRDVLESVRESGVDLPRVSGGVFTVPNRSAAHLNITRVSLNGRPADVTDAEQLTAAEIEGRRQVMLYGEVFRKHVPGFENAYVIDSGAQLGIRESRIIGGRYVLTEEDVLNEARFDDAIGCGAWPVELHTPDRATIWRWLREGGYYQMPYRMLLPTGVDGLLVAGRCMSATHGAQASVRASANCFAAGEAAGTAAAMAVASNVEPAVVSVAALRQKLSELGALVEPRPAQASSHGATKRSRSDDTKGLSRAGKD